MCSTHCQTHWQWLSDRYSENATIRAMILPFILKKAVDNLNTQVNIYDYDLVIMPESSSKDYLLPDCWEYFLAFLLPFSCSSSKNISPYRYFHDKCNQMILRFLRTHGRKLSAHMVNAFAKLLYILFGLLNQPKVLNYC